MCGRAEVSASSASTSSGTKHARAARGVIPRAPGREGGGSSPSARGRVNAASLCRRASPNRPTATSAPHPRRALPSSPAATSASRLRQRSAPSTLSRLRLLQNESSMVSPEMTAAVGAPRGSRSGCRDTAAANSSSATTGIPPPGFTITWYREAHVQCSCGLGGCTSPTSPTATASACA